MLQQLQVVAGSVLTLFLLMAVGFFFGKKEMLNNESLSQMSRILLNAVIPAVMIDTFQVERTPAVDRQLLISFLALAGTYALYMVGSCLLFRREGEDHRGILRFASIYGNTGFMGLPLIQSILGNKATMVAATSLAIFNIVTFTHGVAIIGGKGSTSVKKAVLNPATLGFLAAFVLYIADFRLPAPVGNAVGYLSNLNSPLAMVIIGGQMAHTDILAAFRTKKLYAASALKLLFLPVFTALVLLPFRLEPVIFTTLVILAGCPTAGVTSLFSQSMGKDASLAARQITLSTLLCILTLPLCALLAQGLAG